jgi:hypothetical protein
MRELWAHKPLDPTSQARAEVRLSALCSWHDLACLSCHVFELCSTISCLLPADRQQELDNRIPRPFLNPWPNRPGLYAQFSPLFGHFITLNFPLCTFSHAPSFCRRTTMFVVSCDTFISLVN